MIVFLWAVLATAAAVLMTISAVICHRDACREQFRRQLLEGEVSRCYRRIKEFEIIVATDEELLTDAQELQDEAKSAMARQTLDLLEKMALRGIPAEQQVENLLDWLQPRTDVMVISSFLERLNDQEPLRPSASPAYKPRTSQHPDRPDR